MLASQNSRFDERMVINMKLGIYGSAYKKLYGEERYIKMKSHGFDCTDYGLTDTDSDPIYSIPEEQAKKIAADEAELASKSGITISQIHGPWRWPPLESTDEERAARLEQMKRSVRLCNVAGVKNWVVHPIMPFGIDDKGTGNEQATHDLNIEFMSKLLEEAKKFNVTICLENMPMPNFSIGTPEEILNFVKEMNDESFQICLDTGHVNVYDGRFNIGDEVRRLGGYIKCLHVHDNKYNRDMHLMPYFGTVDWKAFAEGLRNINYDGVFSLETNPPENLLGDIFEEQAVVLCKIAKSIIEM